MYFVAGITGQVGGAVGRGLLEQGREVRALVRDPAKATSWSKRGVDLRRGDLTDAASVATALDGVEAAFVMQPTPPAVTPDFPEARALIAGLREALRRAAPPRLVVLSSVGSEKAAGLGNIMQTHLLEEAFADLTVPTAFVRACALIENNLGALGRAGETGWFDSFLQPVDRAFPMVAAADVGAEVARLLVEGWDGSRRVVEIGSRFSPDDLARAMGEALGRSVRARPLPRERWTAALEAMGLPRGRTAMFEEMQDGFNSGWIDFGVPGTEAVPATTAPAQVFGQAVRRAQASTR